MCFISCYRFVMPFVASFLLRMFVKNFELTFLSKDKNVFSSLPSKFERMISTLLK
jgi:hypothetical protein